MSIGKSVKKMLEEGEIDKDRFVEFTTAIDLAFADIVMVLKKYDMQVALPALISTMVSVCKAISEDQEAAPFESMIEIAHQGIDALKRDFIREGIGDQTNVKGH